MWHYSKTDGDYPAERDALAREQLLLDYGLAEPLEKIERMLHAGDVDAAAEALSDFIRPRHRAPLTWSRERERAA